MRESDSTPTGDLKTSAPSVGRKEFLTAAGAVALWAAAPDCNVVRSYFRDFDLILDGGACRVGVESTIVDLSHGAPRILRPGGVTREAIEACLGREVPHVRDDAVRVPGTLRSHYAPRAEVRLVSRSELSAAVAFWTAFQLSV